MLWEAIDIFAGAGGWAVAAELEDIAVVLAANHNEHAVRTHAQNHPRCRHIQQDLETVDFTKWPRVPLVLASPACQGNSSAATGGKKGRGQPRGTTAKHDRDRATAWVVQDLAEIQEPEISITENVLLMRRWKRYKAWLRGWEDLGYHVQELVLDAADHGVPGDRATPQERERLFVVCSRQPLPPIVVPTLPRVPASSIIDLERGEWQRVRWAAEGVRERVARARSRGFPEGPFITQSTTDHSGRSLDRPLGVVTTVPGQWGVVRPGPKGDEYRVVSVPELRGVCGFRRSYWLPRQVEHATKLLGNAVSPPLGRAVIRAVVQAAEGRAAA
jgi:DNA (cytosine-5)-methyltransferase 1